MPAPHDPAPPTPPLHLFDAYGVELEYMLVDRRSLDVRAEADELLKAASETGRPESEIKRPNGTSWSNELVLHVVEVKVTEPVESFTGVSEALQASVDEANAILARKGGGAGMRLMPGGMHPWMDPVTQTRLWPHEYGEVYANFDRIFDCKRHGWANLQSTHLNLPFCGDDEFGKLHAAVRLILPLLPALCASSPIMDGRITGLMDSRLDVYRTNQAKEPALTGRVIPENVYTQADYEQTILGPIAETVRRLDPSGIMQTEWMNSRGAIARFDRNAIEIRVMDTQESPAADIAICAAVSKVLHWLVEEGPSDTSAQMEVPVEPLAEILGRTISSADQAVIDDPVYLDLLAYDRSDRCQAWELWSEILELAEVDLGDALFEPLEVILDQGPLARRITRALGDPGPNTAPERETLAAVYRSLCDCLDQGVQYRGVG